MRKRRIVELGLVLLCTNLILVAASVPDQVPLKSAAEARSNMAQLSAAAQAAPVAQQAAALTVVPQQGQHSPAALNANASAPGAPPVQMLTGAQNPVASDKGATEKIAPSPIAAAPYAAEEGDRAGQCNAGGCTNFNINNPTGVLTTPCDDVFYVASTCVYGGDYAYYSVTAGNTYDWSLCTADGGSASFDTQLTVTDEAGVTPICYSDDFCGLQSGIEWLASFTGNVRVLVTQYYCSNNTTCATLVWRCRTVAARPCPVMTPPDTDLGVIGEQEWAYFAEGNCGNEGKWVGQFTGEATKNYHFDLCLDSPGSGDANFDIDIKICDAAGNILAGQDGSCVVSAWHPNDFIWTCPADGTYYVVLAPYPSYYQHYCTGTASNTFIMNYYKAGPCVVTCPEGGIPEPEPCGEDTDGGCNIVPNAFAQIACGDIICGTAWANSSLRDTDWYELNLNEASTMTWSVEAEFPVLIFIMHANAQGDCSFGYTVLGSATANPCSTVALAADGYAGGIYWFWAGPSLWGNLPCPLNYVGILSCTPVPVGACCLPDGACIEAPASACAAQNGTYQGDGTLCESVVCVPCGACPPGGIPEPEPCGEDTDGGCNITPNMFAPIACGDIICGTAWANPSLRDTDWYELNAFEASAMTWELDADFPALIFIIHANQAGNCSAGYTILGSATANPCQPLSLTAEGYAGGVYWFWAGLSTWGDYPCPRNYAGALTCVPIPTGACCLPNGSCLELPASQCAAQNGTYQGDGVLCASVECAPCVECPPEGIPEPEPCGQDTDGGCNITPNAFAPVTCGEVICGTVWANSSLRDTDWYELVLTEGANVSWTVQGDFPLLIFLMAANQQGNCAAGYSILGSATANPCMPATLTGQGGAGAVIWLWAGPSVWGNYPCTFNYTGTVGCTPITDYCAAGANICDEYISRVQIGAIDNPSGCEAGQYANYTYLSADTPMGVPTPLVVTNGNPIWTADVCSTWVDWNHDFIFTDAAPELIGDVNGVGPYNFDVTPPSTTLFGPTRMRIRIDYANANPNPCGTVSYGEVEDYTVNVLEVPGACCSAVGDLGCSYVLMSECTGFWVGPYVQCSGQDCNGNLNDDLCDIVSGSSQDCDHNGVPDECQVFFDCNQNGIPDFCDIAEGISQDCNGNGIPDECDVPPLCQAGQPGFPAVCSNDCQGDLIPDECQLAGGLSLQLDDGSTENNWGAGQEIAWIDHYNASGTVKAIGTCFGSVPYPGSSGVTPGQTFHVYVWSDPNGDGNPSDGVLLGTADGTVDAGSIDSDQVTSIAELSPPVTVSGSFFIGASVNSVQWPAPADDDGWTGAPDQGFLNFNNTPYNPNDWSNLYAMSMLGYPQTVFMVRVVGGGGGDCNNNGIPDACDVPPICQGPQCSQDCNGNLIPDECELAAHDCNANGRPDDCDIASGTSTDCNGNGIPDECELPPLCQPGQPGFPAVCGTDCNSNGILDECDLANCNGAPWCSDCNHNGILDVCDIANGTSCDCQLDGIPDECQLNAKGGDYPLQWDDGSTENSLGLTAGGELCWLAHFTKPAGEPTCHVAQIATSFGTPSFPGSSGVSAGQTVRVYVWNDPNGDGNPSDAAFLGEASGTVEANSIDTDEPQTIMVDTGQDIGDSFFVGASVVTTAGYPSPMDTDGPQFNEAWIVFNTVPFDPVNLGATMYNMTDIGYTCNWLLRTVVSCGLPANDCNGNGIPDECDIGTQFGGFCAGQGPPCFPATCASDWNHNGVPDSCEICGDLDNDGNVDIDDYWMFVDAFGTCVGDPKYFAPADMDSDGCVTLVDYQAWRMCYKMANGGKDFVAPKPKPMPMPKPAKNNIAR